MVGPFFFILWFDVRNTNCVPRTGPITYFHLAGEPFILLNSLETTLKMLDAKSAIYSDRPIFPMLGETMGWNRGVVLARYGERFRAFRRLLHRFMGTRAIISQHHDAITKHTYRYLQRLLDAPEQFVMHTRAYANLIRSSSPCCSLTSADRTAGSVVLDLVYGYQTKEHDDDIVHIAEIATLEFSRAATPGAFLVDSLPFCKCSVPVCLASSPRRLKKFSPQCAMSLSGSREPGGRSWAANGGMTPIR